MKVGRLRARNMTVIKMMVMVAWRFNRMLRADPLFIVLITSTLDTTQLIREIGVGSPSSTVLTNMSAKCQE